MEKKKKDYQMFSSVAMGNILIPPAPHSPPFLFSPSLSSALTGFGFED